MTESPNRPSQSSAAWRRLALTLALAVLGCSCADRSAEAANSIGTTGQSDASSVNMSADATAAADLVDVANDATGRRSSDALEIEDKEDSQPTRWPDAALSAPTPAGPVWNPLGSVSIGPSGHSLPMQVTVNTDDRYVALRIRPLEANPEAPWCYGIDEVTLADGTSWLASLPASGGASTEPFGSQRALPQHGYGVFVLPNDGVSALPQGPMTFRVVLRDCRFDVPATRGIDGPIPGVFAALPKAVWVEAAHEPSWPSDAPMRLEVRVAVGASSGFPTKDLAANLEWNVALQRASALFATAGVQLEVGRTAVVDLPKILVYGPGKRAALDAAWEQAMTALTDEPGERSDRFVAVVLVGCLVREVASAGGAQEYAGQTARIPGGAPFESSANGVFLARSGCLGGGEVLSGEALGAVLAHELGHHLGLLHSTTPLGEQRSRQGYVDIMQAGGSLLNAKGFSTAQRVALRRHFDVVPAKTIP